MTTKEIKADLKLANEMIAKFQKQIQINKEQSKLAVNTMLNMHLTRFIAYKAKLEAM